MVLCPQDHVSPWGRRHTGGHRTDPSLQILSPHGAKTIGSLLISPVISAQDCCRDKCVLSLLFEICVSMCNGVILYIFLANLTHIIFTIKVCNI